MLEPVLEPTFINLSLKPASCYYSLTTFLSRAHEMPFRFWLLYCWSFDSLLPCSCFILEKAMAPHSSTFAWKIPRMEEPGGLRSMGLLRVGHDWATSLSVFTFTFHFHTLEKAMAPHSSALAWKIPWTEEPGRLRSMGSLRIGHDSVTSLSLFTFTHWRRKWQPTPVLLAGDSQGQGSLVGCHLWDHKESDTAEVT